MNAISDESTSWYAPSSRITLQVHQRVAGEHAVLHGVLRTGIHRRDVLARNAAAGDLVLEFVGRAVLADKRLDGNENLRNWPEPPVCFLWVNSTLSTARLIVSL